MKSKSYIEKLKRKIAAKQREKAKLTIKEEQARNTWSKAYSKYIHAAESLALIKVHGTDKEKRLQQKVLGWPQETVKLTRVRNNYREQIKKVDEELIQLGLELAKLSEQQNSQIHFTDEIVKQIFALNEIVVRAARDREECLNRHVFPRLVEDGKVCSRVHFTTSDGLRRVVALVNTMTLIQGDLARNAQTEIEKFFSRFQATAMDTDTKLLFQLTKQILVEKTTFKVGPNLYRFLGLELDANIFPELSEAQRLLRLSIRSERTTQYIRIYERNSRTEKWRVVPQS